MRTAGDKIHLLLGEEDQARKRYDATDAALRRALDVSASRTVQRWDAAEMRRRMKTVRQRKAGYDDVAREVIKARV